MALRTKASHINTNWGGSLEENLVKLLKAFPKLQWLQLYRLNIWKPQGMFCRRCKGLSDKLTKGYTSLLVLILSILLQIRPTLTAVHQERHSMYTFLRTSLKPSCLSHGQHMTTVWRSCRSHQTTRYTTAWLCWNGGPMGRLVNKPLSWRRSMRTNNWLPVNSTFLWKVN